MMTAINYIDRIIQNDVILRYSRTAQALSTDTPKKFDAVLADASLRQIQKSEMDTLIAETAQKYSQAAYISGRYDAILAAYTRNGELA